MNTVKTSAVLNLSPLTRKTGERPSVPQLPKDEMVYQRPEGGGPSLAQIGLAALGVLSAAPAAMAAPPQVQSQRQTTAYSLVDQVAGPGLQFYARTGILGQETPISRDAALDSIGTGHEVVMRRPGFEAHVDSLEKLHQLAHKSPGLNLVSPESQNFFAISQQNDSMSKPFTSIPTQSGNHQPGKQDFDDDGWTAEVRADFANTRGNEQWVGSARYSMITQRGAWQPGPDYKGLRTDLAEFAIQKNHMSQLGPSTRLIEGVGLGVQSLGPMQGHDVQEWVHKNLGLGGRTGDVLQHTYTTSSVTTTPIVSGGVGLIQQLGSGERAKWVTTLEGTVPLGRGLTTLRAESGLEYQLTPSITLGAGANLAAVHSNHPALDFLHADGVRPGTYAQAQWNVTKNLHAFGRIQTGGVQNEPLYVLGVSFGGGAKPWLRPF